MNATLNPRQQAQLAFVASGAELQVGQPQDCPLPLATLVATDGSEPYVSRTLSGGLTAHVYRIEAAGRSWTLKRARERCLVQLGLFVERFLVLQVLLGCLETSPECCLECCLEGGLVQRISGGERSLVLLLL